MPRNKKKIISLVGLDSYQIAQKLHQKVCHNTLVGGGDCLGELKGCNTWQSRKGHQEIYSQDCDHEDYRCSDCQLDICGCCYENGCPRCGICSIS